MSQATTFPLIGDATAPGISAAFPNPETFDDAKVRLIVAGETLFAERSIESVSLREIAAAAGNGNNNAVQYHFGGKDGLIQAIFAYRVWQMDRPRLQGLERLEAHGKNPDFRTLLELLYLPLLEIRNEAGRHSYAGFITKYVLQNRPSGVPHAMDSRTRSTDALRRLNAAIEERLCDLPPGLVVNRIAAAYLMFVTMLVRSDNDGIATKSPHEFAERIEDCLTMATAALAAPGGASSGLSGFKRAGSG